jgi:hypothetical protein
MWPANIFSLDGRRTKNVADQCCGTSERDREVALVCKLGRTVILVLGQTASTHVLTVDLFSFAGECNVAKETCVVWW